MQVTPATTSAVNQLGARMSNRLSLTWDGNPAHIAWSAQLIESVTTALGQLELGNADAFIAGYAKLSQDNRIRFWCELVIAMAWFESGWKPDTIYHEPAPLNMDSIGLLQLSYADAKHYPLEPLDIARKSLQDPLVNLRCGVTILATLVAQNKTVAESTGQHKGAARYWSVIRPGPAHHQDEIKARVRHALGM